jgi:CarD family transcriptional regulator
MFIIGDIVVFGKNGVCRVKEIGTMTEIGGGKDKLYYTLVPMCGKDCRVYTPVDNDKAIMRSVMTKEAAQALIDEFGDLETGHEIDERLREQDMKVFLQECDSTEWARLVKLLHQRKQARLLAGKSVTACDEKYLHITEEYLYGELAVSLKLEREDIKDLMLEQLN